MDALRGLIMLTILLFLIKKHRDLSVDNYRDELFRIRHKLFMLATDSLEFSYENEAYRYFEQNINSSIRFAHKLNFLRLFITSKVFKYKKIDIRYVESERKNILRNIKNQHINQELKIIENELTNAMFKFFIETSLFFKVILIVSTLNNSKISENEQIKTGMKNSKVFNIAEMLATEENGLIAA